MASETERLGISTRRDFHVLCYQHHSEMLPRLPSEPAEGQLYACGELACLVRYHSLHGYFVDPKVAKTIELEITPRVGCPKDGQFMYLAEVIPQRRSFRLWKCPQCNGRRTNDEETSGGLGKERGA